MVGVMVAWTGDATQTRGELPGSERHTPRPGAAGTTVSPLHTHPHLQDALGLVELARCGADVDQHHKAPVAVEDVLEEVGDLMA
jgi:hypothetical protein